MATSETPQNPLDQVFTLLKAKDDTSRFVGLSLLQSLLDSRKDLRETPEVLSQSWKAISKPFLIRLLRTSPTEKVGVDDAQNMKQLAVAIVHTFANLLSTEELEAKAMVSVCDPLMLAICGIEAPSQMLAFQALQCIGSAQAGAAAILSSPVLQSQVLDLAKGDELHSQEILKLLRAIRTSGALSKQQINEWDNIVIALLERIKNDPAQLFEMLADAMSSSEVVTTDSPTWLHTVLGVLREQITQRPTARVRSASVLLAGNLLHNLPPQAKFPTILFQDPSGLRKSSPAFAYVFVKFILIDIRSTIPELMTTLTAPSYLNTALRLAASYDILSAFLLALIMSLGDDEADAMPEASLDSLVPLDQLDKLRSELSEAFSLTLEYFRDRWDASVAGSAGLHLSTQAPEDTSSSSGPLLLAWDNPTVSPAKDPIILAGLRAVALWLREDDNETLREQSVGILDMLLALYKLSAEDQSVDFRSPVLTALSGMLPSLDVAVQDFLDQDGWTILADDLSQILHCTSPAMRTQDLVRVLLAVVDSEAVTRSREAWLQLISSAANTSVPPAGKTVVASNALEDIVNVYQLAVAIYLKAPKRLQRLFRSEVEQLRLKATSIYERAVVTLPMDSAIIQGAEDVIASLATLPE